MPKYELVVQKAENGYIIYETTNENRKYFVARAYYDVSDIIQKYFEKEDD